MELSSCLPRLPLGGIAACLGILTLAALPQRAQAQANLTFSGGGGTPITMTLASPLSYTITGTVSVGNAPVFVFQGVGNPFGNIFPPVTGTMRFSINGGALQPITKINSGYTGVNVVANDTYVFGALPGVTIGDTILLAAGTVTTNTNIAAAAPSNGSYNTFIMNNNGTQVSTLGSSAVTPELPGLALVVPALLPVAMMALRRRRSKPSA